MAKTFAQHLQTLTERGPARAAQKARCPTNPRSSAPTYASVVLLMALGAGATAPAQAAADGETGRSGATSSARLGLSLIIPERLNAHGFGELRLQPEADGSWQGFAEACVSGRGAQAYSVTAEWPRGAAVDYDLSYQTASAGADWRSAPVTMGQALQQLAGAGPAGCAAKPGNARLQLRVGRATDPRSMGALTLVLAPE